MDKPGGTYQNPKLLTFQELRRMVLDGDFLKNIFRFSFVQLQTYRLQSLPLPLIVSILIRLMSRNKCEIIDEAGNKASIGFSWIIRLSKDFIRDLFSIPFLLKRVRSNITSLAHNQNTLQPLPDSNLLQSPVYLRTDLFYGLSTGGSICHISGIFNNLNHFTGKPLMISTDAIPLIPSDLECLHIYPEKAFHDFRDLPKINFNFTFQQQAPGLLTNKNVSFFYQRYSLYNYSGLQLALSRNIPFILEYNGSEIWINKNWSKSLKFEALANKIELLNLNGAHVVVVVSDASRGELLERGIEEDKILVNPNGVDSEIYSPEVDGSEIRRKYNLEGKSVIGFIGTFGKWHGAEVLAKAFGLLIQKYPQYRDTVRLLMIGDGHTMTEVQRLLEVYEITRESILTGMVPQEEGPEHLAACDILASPHVPNPDGTPFFGSPTKLFEYMAMGKGIVASDLDQIGEVLQDDHTARLVKPGDAESLMHGLKSLIDNPETRKRLGEAARREVVAKYTWKEHTRKIIEKLKERCPCD